MTNTFHEHLTKHPHVAILRGLTRHDADMVTDTLLEAGWRTIEVPLNRPGALEALEMVVRRASGSGALIGAGTVTSLPEAEAAKAAGAEFFLSPHTDYTLTSELINRGLHYVPGAQTVSEIFTALRGGAQTVKLFPFSHLGADFISAVRGVISPNIHLMAVGGVTIDTVASTMPPANSVGVGSSLYTPGIDQASLATKASQWLDSTKG